MTPADASALADLLREKLPPTAQRDAVITDLCEGYYARGRHADPARSLCAMLSMMRAPREVIDHVRALVMEHPTPAGDSARFALDAADMAGLEMPTDEELDDFADQWARQMFPDGHAVDELTRASDRRFARAAESADAAALEGHVRVV